MRNQQGLGVKQAVGAKQGWKSLPRWFRYGIVIVLALGIFFRFYNLDKKVYWIDEVNSSLRSLGYTKTEVIDNTYTGEVITVADLMQYQQLSPDRGWGDTWHALSGTAEHAPLYFLLSRLWVGWVGHSVATMRCLTAIFSVLTFPCLYWLCRELFEAPAVGWLAVALVAISPLHLPYAQEARPYSLWTLVILCSSAALLRAMRVQTRWSWAAYGISLALGLYTQLLFGAVAVAQGIYVLLVEKLRWTKTLQAYGITAALAFLSFVPWIINFFNKIEKVKESTASLTGGFPLSHMVDRWFLQINQALIDRELGGLNFILVLLVIYTLYYFYRHAPKRSALFILLLVGVTFLSLALPDLVWGGRRSLRIRYLFPFFLGIQIALAYLFATTALWAKTWQDKFWRMVLVFLIFSGIASGLVSSQATVWWNKSEPRSSYYPILGSMMNQIQQNANPLIINDGSSTDMMAFSYWLDPDIKLMLAMKPAKLKMKQAEQYSPILLLNPERHTRRVLDRRGYNVTLLYEDTADPEDVEQRLWLVQKKPE